MPVSQRKKHTHPIPGGILQLSKARREEMLALRKLLDVGSVDLDLLSRSLTHCSFSRERRDLGVGDYERLEFLGDAVLGLVVAEYMHERFPELDEGQLTKTKSEVVSMHALAARAEQLQLGQYLLMGRGEAVRKGGRQPSLLADCFESVLAAIYLDRGLKAATKLVLRLFKDDIDQSATHGITSDYKSQLQEYCQARGIHLHYVVVSQHGPEHHKTFEVEARMGGTPVSRGTGSSKKAAQHAAARVALSLGVTQQ